MASNANANQPSAPVSIFQGRFLLRKLLGKGGFGEVYSGIQTSTGEQVAVKLERNTGSNSFLFHEARVMQEVQKRPPPDNIPAIATLKYFGQEGEFRMLIMTLQGASLEDIHEKRHRFSLKTTVMLAHQMISRLQYVHGAGYVHRDLKPDNFLVGAENPKRIYLVDFGLSARYLGTDGTHREMQSGKSFVGTSRYASLRTHQGFSQSRRDDLEQLVYIMIYMYRGCLPWSGLPIRNRDEKEKRIGEIKLKNDPVQICAKCPHQFADLLFYARNMGFTEEPQYDMCRVLMSSVLEENYPKETMDYEFDWLKPVSSPPRDPLSPVQRPAAPVVASGDGGDNEARSPNGGPNLMSNAKAAGVFSGFGSGHLSQEIMSLGSKN